MDVPDPELKEFLEARDGPLGSRWRPHMSEGRCPYPDLYPEGDCPWCAAELAREAAGLPPSPQRGA